MKNFTLYDMLGLAGELGASAGVEVRDPSLLFQSLLCVLKSVLFATQTNYCCSLLKSPLDLKLSLELMSFLELESLLFVSE